MSTPLTPEPIYRSPAGAVANWRITVAPLTGADPSLVAFVCWSRTRKRLDQIARWDGSSWDPTRWVPKPPTVPGPILARVEDQLRRRRAGRAA